MYINQIINLVTISGSKKTKLTVACFIYAVYNVHNHLRHNGNNSDLNKQLCMSLSAVAVPKLLRTAWEELFKHPHQLDL